MVLGRDEDCVSAPLEPPPLLTHQQVEQLCCQGHLGLALPAYLETQVDNLFALSEAFFKLGEDHKSALFSPIPGIREQGYAQIQGEKEFISILCRSTTETFDSLPCGTTARDLERSAAEVWQGAAQILHRILVDIGSHLGYIAPSAWDSIVAGTLALPDSSESSTTTLLRIFRYDPEKGFADPHKDLGLLTLCMCRGRGLQVCQRSDNASNPNKQDVPEDFSEQQSDSVGGNTEGAPGSVPNRWQDAAQATVLTGDMLRILSGNKAQAGLHRVVATEQGRSSIVFALRPSTACTIDLHQFGGQGWVSSKELWERLRKNRVNVNASATVREAQARNWRKSRAREDIA
ncbi:hypothetical protein GQ53DRAFT_740881 [Thozetella sp. PMI_491]|nr:hypothetical protein GQ53DRAFT_740881 [Thozetella sp. PMI_491]